MDFEPTDFCAIIEYSQKQMKSLKILKIKKTKAKRVFWQKMAKDPFIDWGIIFVIASVLSLILIGFGLRIFINFDEVSSQSSTGSETKIDKVQLKKVIDMYEDRNVQRTGIEEGMPQFSDPS